jgi:DNA-binding IscR family transcriptional regulator
MAEVVAALEGDIAPIECITADADGVLTCSREGAEPCPTKLLWTRVQGSIVRTLNDMTLDDLVQPLRGSAKPNRSREAGSRTMTSDRGAGSPAEVTTSKREARGPAEVTIETV